MPDLSSPPSPPVGGQLPRALRWGAALAVGLAIGILVRAQLGRTPVGYALAYGLGSGAGVALLSRWLDGEGWPHALRMGGIAAGAMGLLGWWRGSA